MYECVTFSDMANKDRTTAGLLLQCMTCKVSTFDPRQLVRHVVLNRHATTCPVCYKHKSSEALQRHVSRCYAPFTCGECQAVISVRAVVRHLRKHHSESGFFCPVGCAFRYHSVEDYLYGRHDHECN